MVMPAAALGDAELGAYCVTWCLGLTQPQAF